jgi:hypothetical protein
MKARRLVPGRITDADGEHCGHGRRLTIFSARPVILPFNTLS